MSVLSKENTLHYNWGEVCDGWHLLRSPGLSIIEERVPAGHGETTHYHQHAEQFFYVLSGVASMEINNQQYELTSRQGIHVPPGHIHRLYNRHADELVFLVISAPPAQPDRIDITNENSQ